MQAESNLLRRGDLVIQFRAVGEKIEVVGGGRASRKGKLRERGLRRDKNILGVQARPDGIERRQPVEEIGILRGRDGTRQRLVEVMVCVDQPRQDDVPLQIEHFVRVVGQTGSLPYPLDESAANKKTTIGNLPLMVIHSDNVGVLDE